MACYTCTCTSISILDISTVLLYYYCPKSWLSVLTDYVLSFSCRCYWKGQLLHLQINMVNHLDVAYSVQLRHVVDIVSLYGHCLNWTYPFIEICCYFLLIIWLKFICLCCFVGSWTVCFFLLQGKHYKMREITGGHLLLLMVFSFLIS